MASSQSKHPSKEELEECFYLDGEDLYRIVHPMMWKRNGVTKKVENKVNCPQGYCNVGFKGRTIKYHNIKWILMFGTIPKGHTIDHIDRNKINNKFENLRLATDTQQAINRECQENKKGYYFNKARNKWMTQISINSKRIYLGLFTTELEARQAFLKARELAHLYNNDDKAFKKLIKTN